MSDNLIEKKIQKVTDKLYHIILYRVHLAWVGFELTTLVVIGTDCIGGYKSDYHAITTMTIPFSNKNDFSLFNYHSYCCPFVTQVSTSRRNHLTWLPLSRLPVSYNTEMTATWNSREQWMEQNTTWSSKSNGKDKMLLGLARAMERTKYCLI